MDEYTKNLNAIAEQQKKQNLDAIKAKELASLSTLNADKSQIAPTYQKQREIANVNNQKAKVNFAVFSSNRGQTNSGLSAQNEMSSNNALQNSYDTINTAENTQTNDINRRISDVRLGTANDISVANQGVNIDTATKLLAYREQLRRERLAREEEERTVARSRAKAGSRGGYTKSTTQTSIFTDT